MKEKLPDVSQAEQEDVAYEDHAQQAERLELLQRRVEQVQVTLFQQRKTNIVITPILVDK